jgi:hypothetical protein
MDSNPISLEDRLAIQGLLARYCHAMDASRADLASGLFAEDAVLETPVGEARGREAIRAWIEGRLELRSPRHQVGHYLLNPLIAASSPDEARVRSMLIYTRQEHDRDGSAELLSTGIYEDEVVLREGLWQFARRRWTLSAALDDVYFTS